MGDTRTTSRSRITVEQSHSLRRLPTVERDDRERGRPGLYVYGARNRPIADKRCGHRVSVGRALVVCGVTSGNFWSSTTDDGSGSGAWDPNLDAGYSIISGKDISLPVWLVRRGPR